MEGDVSRACGKAGVDHAVTSTPLMPSVELRSKIFDNASFRNGSFQSRSAALNDSDFEVIDRKMVTSMIIGKIATVIFRVLPKLFTYIVYCIAIVLVFSTYDLRQ